MWTLRILNGPQAGKTYSLKAGTNVVGRAPHCDSVVTSSGVSKEHAKIDLLNEKIIVTDLNSRNGTFVEGIKISSKSIKLGEKFSLHNVIFDIQNVQPEARMHNPNLQNPGFDAANAYHAGNVAQQMSQQNQDPNVQAEYQQPNYNMHSNDPSAAKAENPIKLYIDNVVLPGVYKVLEVLEFKWTLGAFIAAFIVFVTLMSAIPLMTILSDSIKQESRQRAVTIAKTLYQLNKSSVAAGVNSALSVNFANNESGVEAAYIFDAIDQTVIAPASQAGESPDIDFAYEAFSQGKASAVKQVDKSTIVAVVGIPVFDPEAGVPANKAYVVVKYDMGQLAIDNDKTISLFVQTLFIALMVGSILFFFLYKLIVHPIEDINKQLDQSLKDQSNNIDTPYLFPQLKDLILNINSSLSRAGSSQGDEQMGSNFYDRSREMENIVNVIGFPSIVISAEDNSIQAINPAFEDRTNQASSELLYGNLDNILDQALKLNINDLLEQLAQQPGSMVQSQLDINGDNFDITAQDVYGMDKVAYYIVVLLPASNEEEVSFE